MRIRAMVVAVMLILATAGVSWVGAPRAFACSCAMLTVEEYADAADVVARGTVTDVDRPAEPSSSTEDATYSIDITEAWKGDVPARVEVLSAVDGASCGWEGIEVGMELILFATNDGDVLRSNLCDGSGPVDETAAETLTAHLGEPGPPAAVPAEEPVEDPDRNRNAWITGGLVVAMIGVAAAAVLAARRH